MSLFHSSHVRPQGFYYFKNGSPNGFCYTSPQPTSHKVLRHLSKIFESNHVATDPKAWHISRNFFAQPCTLPSPIATIESEGLCVKHEYCPLLSALPNVTYIFSLQSHFGRPRSPSPSSSLLTFGPNSRMDSKGEKGEKKQTLV